MNKNDGSYGAFNIHCIRNISNDSIVLNNGKAIKVLESKNCVSNRIEMTLATNLFMENYVTGNFSFR